MNIKLASIYLAALLLASVSVATGSAVADDFSSQAQRDTLQKAPADGQPDEFSPQWQSDASEIAPAGDQAVERLPQPQPAPAAAASGPSGLVEIEADDGKLSASLREARLADVASRLAEATGYEVKIDREELNDARVNMSFERLPLREGIERILAGFSFVVAESTKDDTGRIMIYGAKTATVATAVAAPGEQAAIRLRDLDEFRPLDEHAVNVAVNELGEHASEEERLAALEAQREAQQDLLEDRVDRALAVLDSEHDHLRLSAIDELVGVNDTRASKAIFSIASDANLPASDRRIAAEALARHAADLQYQDASSLQSLGTLSNDPDPLIREISQHALDERERFDKRHSTE